MITVFILLITDFIFIEHSTKKSYYLQKNSTELLRLC